MFFKIKNLVLLIMPFFLIEYVASFILSIAHIYDTPKKIALPSNSCTTYKSPFLNFSVKTNYLGYRGEVVPKVKKENTIRVLVLGNSFVYGWGLNDHETWPFLLQEKLKSKGINAEIINAGTPGTTSQMCYEVLTKALPLFNPDLVILAVLQGGFLKTMDPGEEHGTSNNISDTEELRKKFMTR